MVTRTRSKAISAVAAFLAAIVLGGVATTIHRYMPEGLAGAAAGVFLTAVTILLVMIGFNASSAIDSSGGRKASESCKVARRRELARVLLSRAQCCAIESIDVPSNVNGYAQRREPSMQPTIPITQRRQPVASELAGSQRLGRSVKLAWNDGDGDLPLNPVG